MTARRKKTSTGPRADARRSRGGEGRARLLEAATVLVAERGARGTPVGELCEQAGVARTALYWHFGSKEGLIAEVVQTAGTALIERLRKQVYLEGDPFQRVDRLIEGWREILAESPELIRLPMLVQLERGGDAEGPVGRAVARVHELAEAALVEGLEDSVGSGLEAPERVAWSIMALFQGAAARQVGDPTVPLDDLFDELRRTILIVIWSRLAPEARAELERAAAALDL